MSLLNNYTFENFFVGRSNRRVVSKFKAIAEGSCKCEPIFIYAPIGCGKTHLLLALRTQIGFEHKKCLYVTATDIASGYLERLVAKETTDDFDSYTEYSAVLIDECDCMAGKDASQEYVLRFINGLSRRGIYVVAAANVERRRQIYRFPQRKLGLKNGKLLKLSYPTFNIKLRFVKELNRHYGLSLSEKCMKLLARRIRTIGDLSGTLKNISFTKNVMNKPLTQKYIKEVSRR